MSIVTKRRPLLIAVFLAALLQPCAAHADPVVELRNLRDATIGLVNDLVEQGVLTREKADAIIRKALEASGDSPAGGAAAGAPTTAAPVPGATPAPAAGAVAAGAP